MRAVDLDLLEIIEEKNEISYNELLDICIEKNLLKQDKLDFELENMKQGGYIIIENNIIRFLKDGYTISTK